MRVQRRLILTAGFLVAVNACEEGNLGDPCGSPAQEIIDPIGGEVPTVEVVRMERDGACESFKCLTHRGLPPYCTDACSLDAPPNAQASCTQDEECKGGSFASGATGHCVEGKCICEKDEECKRVEKHLCSEAGGNLDLFRAKASHTPEPSRIAYHWNPHFGSQLGRSLRPEYKGGIEIIFIVGA